LGIGVRALSDLGGGGRDFLARKIYAIPECVIVEIGIQTHSNCTENKLVHNLPCGGEIFRGSLTSRILDFSGFAGKKIANLDFRLYSWENNFSRISCTVFESNKNGSHMVVFVTLCATNFIEVQQCKKKSGWICWKEFF